MNTILLPERLAKIAQMVLECETIADIGCDHGYLPIALIQSRKIRHAIAMDVNPGPLERAAVHVEKYGLTDQIELRLSNGLERLLSGEAQTAVFAGMGGMLIQELLKNASPEVMTHLDALILQPQTEPDAVRRTLHDLAFQIENEALIQDRGKWYVVIRAVHGNERYENEMEYQYGRVLLERQDPALKGILEKKYRQIEEWLRLASDADRQIRLQKEQAWIQEVLKSWRI